MKKNIRDIDIAGKKVIVRCDFNVPMKDGAITDDIRIRAALPTIEYLLEEGCALILMSQMGRPKGEPKMEYTLKPVADRLTELLARKVRFISSPTVVDDEVRLYRVMDISLKRTLTQRIFGLGTIRICSGDKSLGDFELINVKHPKETKELISELVEPQRDKKRVINRDDMNRGHMHGDDFEPHDFHDFDDADGIGMEHGHEDFDMDDDAPFER